MNRTLRIFAFAGLLVAGSAVAEEVWWPDVEGEVRAVAIGVGAEPDLFALVREPLPEDEAEEEDSDSRRAWSVKRWTRSAPEQLSRVVEIPPTHDRPWLQRLGGDRPELVLAFEQQIWRFPIEALARGGPAELPEPSFRDPSPDPRVLSLDPRGSRVVAAGIGEAEIFDLETAKSLYRTRLPTEVTRGRTGLQLESPPVQILGQGTLFVAGPQSLADLRLLSMLFEVESDDGDEPQEAWSLLPGPERIEDFRYQWIEGRPFLLCVTLRADKQGIFEKKKVRLFELRSDRTRAGTPPTLEMLSSARMWQQLGVHLVDADLDGKRDLVLLAPEGFSGNKLLVDLYTGVGGGRFATRNFRTVLQEFGEDHPRIYGNDWTDDDIPDLVALRDGILEIFAGRAKPTKKAVLEAIPSRSLSLDAPGSLVDRLEPHGPWIVGWGRRARGTLVIVDPRP